MKDHLLRYASPLGGITVASDGTGLVGLWFDDQKYFGAGLCAEREERSDSVLELAARWLDFYFSGKDPGFVPPLSLRTTPFRAAVVEALQEIPYGRTTTYKEIAARLSDGGRRTSARAVGGAVGHNPISLVVPCHRVIGSDGSLVGYAGGLDRKARLLAVEGVEISALLGR